jgi:putative ABC transport system permease protein
MVMIERTAEVGTMRAMGVQKAAIRNIFIWEALLIALGGALVGLVAAFLFMGGMGLLSFDTTAFSFFLDQGRVRFAVAVFETLGNVVLLCLMSIAAVYIPARAAANLRPAEALRAS